MNSDVSYSANISRSEITNTKLVGCTVKSSKLVSCAAVDSALRNVNATKSKLTKAIVENSNLKGVELKNTKVVGTDLANVSLVDRTVAYGRSIDASETGALRRLTATKVGTPNYSGKSSGSSSSGATSTKEAAGPKEVEAKTSQPVEEPASTQQVQRAMESAPSGVVPAEVRWLLR